MVWLFSAQRKGVLTVFQGRFTTCTISSTLELNSNKLTLNSTAVKFNSNGLEKGLFRVKKPSFCPFWPFCQRRVSICHAEGAPAYNYRHHIDAARFLSTFIVSILTDREGKRIRGDRGDSCSILLSSLDSVEEAKDESV